ncbi:hypothetical protein [Halorussus caseinilyticus]|uniref:Uncharacterized protein n=1 Tax=Halorussus caseinilyticus TaxID=3034025 RepID=A0ABD5WEF1_9EURY|nr:hypothetical protein [Halorussus sp. DT72]
MIRRVDRERGDRRRANRRTEQVRELENRVNRLESQVEWLRRMVRSNGENADAAAVSPCPHCRRGVLVRRNDALQCSACEYSRFL